MTYVIEQFRETPSGVKCDFCGSDCVEKFELGDGYSVYQCKKCKDIKVVETMSRDVRIKCTMCKWLHKRDCNSCVEHDARVDQMGILEKIMWWLV